MQGFTRHHMSQCSTRGVGTAAVAIALVAVLAGCTNPASDAETGDGDVVTLTIAMEAEQAGGNPAFDAVLDNFDATHDDIVIKRVYPPLDQYETLLNTQVQGGNAPDLFAAVAGSGSNLSVLRLGKAGKLMDLSDQTWADQVLPAAYRPLYEVDGALYGLPLAYNAAVPIYRTDLFDQAGITPPTTKQELLDDCRDSLDRLGKPFMAMPGAEQYGIGYFAAIVATTVVLGENPQWNQQHESGEVTFSGSSEWQEALQYIVDMNDAGCFPETAVADTFETAPAQAANGDTLSFGPGEASAVPNLQAINPDASFDVFALPGLTEATTVMPMSPIRAVVASATTKHKEAVLEVLDFFATTDQQVAFASGGNYIPVSAVGTGETGNATLTGISDFLAHPERTSPNINLMWPSADSYTVMQQQVQGLLSGQKSVNDILQAMDAAWPQ
ncbi:ABC transporter substrate-binding protein [Microbacterium sp.]|uniref:ABC transporter substrate-binding protein n=1 Tax=Microbacterium sp. TaxID=51671 RepID=UPI0039E60B0D